MKRSLILWVGDMIVIGLVTVTGFASHNELQQAGLRMLTTFIPLLTAWSIVGLPANLFDDDQARQTHQLWRPLWGMLVAGPLAVLLRSFLLGGAPVIPTFAWVITGVTGAAIFIWRLGYYFWFKSRG